MKQPLTPQLPSLTPGDFYLEDEALFEGKDFTETDQSYQTVHNLVLKECRLEKITLQRSRLERFEASHVLFDKCDFSNLEWIGGSFHQCAFHQCKLIGTNFAESYLRDCSFHECVANYASFSDADLKVCHFDDCQLQEAEFFQIRWKDLALTRNELTGSNWLRVKMAGLDFTSNTFAGIMLELERIRGLQVNSEQALVIAAAMGLSIQF